MKVKRKLTSGSSSKTTFKVTTTTTVKKREKKVYSLAGQKVTSIILLTCSSLLYTVGFLYVPVVLELTIM